MTVAQKIAILAVLAIVGASGVSLVVASRHSPPVAVVEPGTAAESASYVTVHVAGCVQHPGVYYLHAGARALDAINAAGGATPAGDLNAINLAEVLSDGLKVELPPARQQSPAPGSLPPEASPSTPKSPAALSAASPPTKRPKLADAASSGRPQSVANGGAPAAAPGVSGGPVSLSRASLQELETVPGIGPERARSIIYYRYEHGGFQRVEELTQVHGIGPALLERIRPYVAP